MPTPNNGPTHGRQRRTQRNLFSKFPKADPFPLRPSDIAGFGAQRAALIFGNKVTRASLAAQAAQTRAQYRMSRTGSIEAGRVGMSDLQGSMAERGIIGSTANQVGIQDVRAGVQGEIQEARFARDTGLTGIALSRLDAEAQLRMGLVGLMQQRRAQQREMALGAFGSGGQNPWGY